MTYSIYNLFGSYFTGKFIVGGFKTLANAKIRCADIISHKSPSAKVTLEIWDTKTGKPVGWMHNEYRGEKGLFYEDRSGNISLYRAW